MRLHRLVVTAFGPFADRQEVDLDALSAQGLFLLHGATGAGKTTVLDSLGYALFGQVPGHRQGARRLRSDHAVAGTATEVTLEVTLRGRRLEVTRRPEQERPKARGRGTTSAPAKVVVREWRDGAWAGLSERVGEADHLLAGLVGMSAQQFFQVVLLPQGDFARFLRSDADSRRALLEQLFRAERFSEVEDWLRERARVGSRELEVGRREVCDVLVRLAEAGGVGCPPQDAGRDWVDGLLADAASARSQAELRAKEATAEVERLRALYTSEVDLARRQARRRDTERRAVTIAAQEPDHRLRRDRLRAARRAAPVLPAVAAAERAGADAARATRRCADLLAGLGPLVSCLASVPAAAVAPVEGPGGATSEQASAVRASLVDAVHRRREELGRLDELSGVEEQANRDAGTLADLDHRLQRAVREQECAAALLAAAPAARHQTGSALARAREATAQVPGLRVAGQALLRRRDAALALDRVVADLHDLQARLGVAQQARDEARSAWLDLRELRLDGMAAELAGRLGEADPCPVCGSPEHPDPAGHDGPAVTRVEEDAAAAEHEAAAALTVELADVLAATATEQARLCAEAGGVGADAEELAVEAAAAATALTAAETLAAGLADAEAGLARHDALEQEQREAVGHWGEEAAGLRSRRQEVADRLGQRRRALADALGGDADISARRARLSSEAGRLLACADAVTDAARLDDAACVARAAAADAAGAAGFPDADAACAAALAEAEESALQAGCDAYEAERSAVTSLLGDPELAVCLEPAAGVDEAALRLAAAEHPAQQLLDLRAGARGAVDQLGRLQVDYEAATARLAPVEAAAAEVCALADLTGGLGQNALRMRLSAYVLAARLEEVAAAASGRLLRMSQGRYSLVHTDGPAGGNRRSGLGLLVRDSWCGADRDPATLSGGETFLASLSLALGLADAVTAEAGGAPVDTLFVDEGFGSLDPDTLEEVLDVLDGLREGNRVVGLVSHVGELQQRIPARLHVHKARQGSSVTLVGC